MEKIYLSQYKQSLSKLYKVLESKPNNTEARIQAAQLLLMNGYINQATQQAMLAYQAAPQNLAALSTLAHILAHYGAKEEAKNFYDDILKIQDDHVLTLFNLVNLEKQKEPNLYTQKCEELLEKESELGAKDRSLLYFALAKVYEDFEDYDKAFGYYHQANKLKRSTLEFDLGAELDFNKLLRNKYSHDFFDSKTFRDTDEDEFVPIFIVSLPRAGSSLTEQILASHSQVSALGEIFLLQQIINDKFKERDIYFHSQAEKLDEADFSDIAKSYYSELQSVDPELKKYVVNKMPANFRYLGLIKCIFPHAKIIHCSRDPIDLCLSCYKHNFANGQFFSFNLDEMVGYYKNYQDLLGHWSKVLPEFIFDLNYEALIGDQQAMTEKLLEFCGLGWEDSCLEFYKQKRHVKTASFDQVKSPLYKASIASWKKYEQHIEPLIQAFTLKK